MEPFLDRQDAGQRLGALLHTRALGEVLVLGLPRGGVPVASEVARALGAPWDIVLVRKLGVPWQEELAFGAIAADGTRVMVPDVVAGAGLDAETIERVVAREREELVRRERRYRGTRPAPEVKGRHVIVVDDGVATGATMRAAVQSLRREGAARVTAAAPVFTREAFAELSAECDGCEALAVPEPFYGVGAFYRDFSQTTDEDVIRMLQAAAPPSAPPEKG